MLLEINKLSDIDFIAGKFLAAIPDKKVIAFYGNMGVGKTTFIKAICRKLGVVDQVSSPTFSLINEYKTPSSDSIFHFDFYRIENIEEAFDIGYEDYFYSDKLCLIEWPEKIEELLPANHLKVRITELPNMSRKLEF